MRISPINNVVINNGKKMRSEKTNCVVKDSEPKISFKRGYIERIYRDGNFGKNPISEARSIFNRLWQQAAQSGIVYNREAASILDAYRSKIILLEDKLARIRKMDLEHESHIIPGVIAYFNGIKFSDDDIKFSADRQGRLVIDEPYDKLCFHDNGMIRKYEHYSSDYRDTTVDRYDKDGNMTFWSLFGI